MTLVEELRWLAEELRGSESDICRRAADLIEKLPRTADGVPVVPGMTVWSWFNGAGLSPIEIQYLRPDGIYTLCYSTREAAEAARRTT